MAAPKLPAFASLLKSREVEDPVNLWLHRPLAYGFVALVYRSAITPNQITLLAMVVGIAAAACFIEGSGAAMLWGGVLLWTSAILDGADGILARAQRKFSELGRALDGTADVVVASTGDDEDNMIIAQLAREKYDVPKVIARVNDPRNQVHFDLLGISPTVCPTRRIMALIEHEVPEHELVHLLELRNENLEIIEVEVDPKCPCIGKSVDGLGLPTGSRLISLVRDGKAELVDDGTVLHAGDQVLAILEPGREDEVRQIILGR